MRSNLFKMTAFKLAVLIGVLFSGLHLVWRAGNPQVSPFIELDLLESKALDIKFKRRGSTASSGKVVIAGIDEKSVQRYGLWPWKRELVGRGLKNLNDAGALAIGVDITYSDPDRSSPHLAVNQIVDKVLAALPPDAQGPAAVPAVAKADEPGATGSAGAAPAKLREVLLASRVEDPDKIFAGMLRDSPRVVLGVMGLVGADLQSVDEAIRKRDEQALDRFYVKELFDPQGMVPDAEGRMIEDWGAIFSAGVGDLKIIHGIGAVQAPLPVIAEAIHHIGIIDSFPDGDGTIRRYSLMTRLGDKLIPSLALASAAVATGSTLAPFLSSVSPGLDGVGLMSGPKGQGQRLAVPVNPWTGYYLINYPGPKNGKVDGKPLYGTVSFADAVDNTFPPEQVKDKVVLVGATAVGTFDQRVTPFDPTVPGVYTHAAVLDNILSQRFISQNSSQALIEMVLLLALAVLFGLFIPRFRIRWQIAFMGGMAAVYSVTDLVLFQSGVLLTTVTPLAEMVSLCFGMVLFNYITSDREKRQIRTAFQFYLTKSVMEDMLKNPDKLKLGGDKRDLTVLFSDIRGFTSISEKLPPEELVRTLNEYLTPMTNLVFKHEGTLDKYMGDAIMAVWGAPLPQPDHALRACTAAVEMLQELQVLRKRWREQGRPDIDIGVGLNSGPMAVGNMGSDMRFDYTVMGDNVNLGSRLEGTNKEYGTNVIISEFTYAQVKGKVIARELGSVRVKGKKKPVVIYELRGIGVASGAEAEAIAAFEKGVAAYRARSWDEAEACFRKVCETWQDDGPSEHYLEDIASKRLHPPPEGWDGVYEMKTK